MLQDIISENETQTNFQFENHNNNNNNNSYQNINDIISNIENLVRASNELNNQQIHLSPFPQITLELAIQIRNIYGNLQHIPSLTHSCIYVPIIRAAQNLEYQNTAWDANIHIRNLIGNNNFNAIVDRLSQIFHILHINAENTGYTNEGYINAHRQIQLITLDETIMEQTLNNNNYLPLGILLDMMLQSQLHLVRNMLIENNQSLINYT